jgi:hypothetical protein
MFCRFHNYTIYGANIQNNLQKNKRLSNFVENKNIMPENKFDLNKVLQAAKLYNKIDYGNLYVPDVQQTMDNFEN